MKISKINNRHYGQFFEQALESTINREVVINKTEFVFPAGDEATMASHAAQLADYLNATSAKRVGNQTSNESCDLYIDEEEVELKYVGSGSGTYFNTSMEYTTLLGFESYHDYLVKVGYIAKLKSLFGDMVSETNISPVSNANSSYIRNNHTSIYNRLAKWEGTIRKIYVRKFYEFLLENPTAKAQFISDMITKNASGKHIPKRLIVFNHSKETITEYTREKLTKLTENDIIELNGYSITFGGVRVTFAWQNGTGLNNPTIRVFII